MDAPFLEDLSAYGRFLIALPLLLVGEKMLSKVLPSIHKYVLETNLVPENEEHSAETLRTRVDQQNSGLLEVLVLVLAFALPLSFRYPSRTPALDARRSCPTVW